MDLDSTNNLNNIISDTFLAMIRICSIFSREPHSHKLTKIQHFFTLERTRIILWKYMTMSTFEMQLAE
jgi:hypothetical protein